MDKIITILNDALSTITSKFNSGQLTQRTLSAVVLIVLTLLAIYIGGTPFALFIIFLCIVSLYEWIEMSLKSEHKVMLLSAGFVYLPLSFLSCYVLREQFELSTGVLLVLLVWGSDIAAYFTGKIIGGPKLLEAISPNKTWAGFFGAFVIPGVIAVFWVEFFDLFYAPAYGVIVTGILSFALGAAAGIVGQAGDLMMSALKRHVGVKDTGRIIPGHGGLLDRIDSLMLAAPMFLAFLTALAYIL